MTYYTDTSVLLKWHIAESGSKWFEVLVESLDTLIATELSIVEVYSALNRLLREGQLRRREYEDISIDFEDLVETRCELIPVSR